MIPTLAGVHHLKLPVTDLDRSIAWYGRCLGYQVVLEFRTHGRRTGVTMTHPDGREVRFYSMEAHADVDPAHPLVVEDAVASAEVKEREWLAGQAAASSAE